MYNPEMRSVLLKRWAEQFKTDYQFDTRSPLMISTMYTALSVAEEGIGPVTIEHEWAYSVTKSDLYEAGVVVAKKWGIPLTQLALVALTIGAKTVEQVTMTLAFIYKQFLEQEKNPQEALIDVQTVWIMMRQGVPSEGFFERMWRHQIIGGYRTQEANLLDVITAEDFKVSTPGETVV